MALAPGSVWLDARGTQSVGHAERGIARYVAEHTRALLELAPELIGWIGLSDQVPVPASARAARRAQAGPWQAANRGPDGRQPAIYHVMSPFEADFELDDVWPRVEPRALAARGDALRPDPADHARPVQRRLGLLGDGLDRAPGPDARRPPGADDLPADRRGRDGAPARPGGAHHRDRLGRLGPLLPRWSRSRAEGEAILRSALPKVRPGFLLYVGGTDFRKNLEGAIRAYAELPAPTARPRTSS